MAKRKKKTESQELDEVIKTNEELEKVGSDDLDEVESNELPKCEPCGGSRIEVVRERNDDDDGWMYYWMLFAENGRMLATNPRPYSRLNDLKVAIQSIKDNIEDVDIVRLY